MRPARTPSAILAVLTLCALAAGACSRDDPAAPRQPDIIIYLVDTLRADHLDVYGYPRETAPRLRAWASEAVVFDRAYAPSSWTRPSVATLLTGLLPLRHRTIGRSDVLSDAFPSLAAPLAAEGYETVGIVSNANVLPIWGFGRGFRTWEDVAAASAEANAEQVVDRALEHLAAIPPEVPALLYVHSIDPHGPYQPPPPYDERFTDSPHIFLDRYDGEIAYADEHYGRFLERLRALGRYENAVIVFVSDHGEEFNDHGGWSHGHTLFEESIRIPLLIKLPGGAHAGLRVAEPVSLADLMPTLLGLAAAPVPPGLDGVDLMAHLDGSSALDPERPVLFDLSLESSGERIDVVRAVRRGHFKLIRRLRPKHQEDLFDLSLDPSEQLGSREPLSEERAALSALLDAYTSSTQRGVHLWLRHGLNLEARRCRGSIRTEGRFVEMRTALLEDEDQVGVDEMARTLHFDATLRNFDRMASGKPVQTIDEDRIHFRVEPADAPIRLEIDAPDDGPEAACALWVGARPRRSRVLEFRATNPKLGIVDTGMLVPPRDQRRQHVAPSLHLGVVRPAARLEQVPESVAERLRALGYAQ
jgi:arylsulfatase A-like enzyme